MRKSFFLLLSAAFSVIFILSCSSSVDDADFRKRMDEVDALIVAGNNQRAAKILDRFSRGSYSALQRLGLYRRYIALGRDESGEKCLRAGLKDLPANPELQAVLAKHLLDRGRLEEAGAAAENLAGTRYGSLGAEISFRISGAGGMSADMARLYRDAWRPTGNEAWLINSAAISALNGDIEGAAALAPDHTAHPRQAVFWASILSDADHGSVASAGRAEAILDGLDTGLIEEDWRYPVLTLKADFLARQGEIDEAVPLWREIGQAKDHPSLQASAYYNIALKAKSEQDIEGWYSAVKSCVEAEAAGDGDGFYSLAALADYALSQSAPPQDSSLEEALRKSGLASREMTREAGVPKVAPGEALLAMEESLKKTGSPRLYVEYLKFLLASHETLASQGLLADHPLWRRVNPADAKDAWLWDALEARLGPQGYPPELARFAFAWLQGKKKPSDAKQVFSLYFRHRYGASLDAAKDAPDLLEGLSAWECEALALIFLQDGRAESGAQVLERLAGDFAETYPDAALRYRFDPPFEVIANLAETEAALGRRDKAEAMYRRSVGTAASPRQRAEALYRLADFQAALGQNQEALMNLSACLALESEHWDARLLQKKIRQP